MTQEREERARTSEEDAEAAGRQERERQAEQHESEQDESGRQQAQHEEREFHEQWGEAGPGQEEQQRSQNRAGDGTEPRTVRALISPPIVAAGGPTAGSPQACLRIPLATDHNNPDPTLRTGAPHFCATAQRARARVPRSVRASCSARSLASSSWVVSGAAVRVRKLGFKRALDDLVRELRIPGGNMRSSTSASEQ
jgi:hypothetical protein